MADGQQNYFESLTNRPVFEAPPHLREQFTKGAESLCERQHRMVDWLNDATVKWFERRHADIDTQLEALRQIMAARTPTDLVQAYQRFAILGVERMAQDGLALQRQILSTPDLMGQPMAEMAEAAQRVFADAAEAGRRATDEALSVGRKVMAEGVEAGRRVADQGQRAMQDGLDAGRRMGDSGQQVASQMAQSGQKAGEEVARQGQKAGEQAAQHGQRALEQASEAGREANRRR